MLARWIWKLRRKRDARRDGYCCLVMQNRCLPCPECNKLGRSCGDQLVVAFPDGTYGIPFPPEVGGGHSLIHWCPWCGDRLS